MDLKECLQKQIDEHKAAVDSLQNIIEALPDSLPDIYGHPYVMIFGDEGRIQIDMPHNLVSFAGVKAILEARGFIEAARVNRMMAGDVEIDFTFGNNKLLLSIVLLPGVTGSTCQRRVIEYRQEPVYEIVCNEA